MSADPPDEQLATRARGGDRRALEELLDRHADRMYAISFRVTRHAEDARDATQEAMIAVVRGIGRFDGRCAFTTWLYRVTTNAALDEVRRRGRRPRPVDDVGERAATDPDIGTAIAGGLLVTELLAALPTEYRDAVALRDLADLEYDEIATILGVPIGTVRSRIARGRGRLARELGNQSPPSEHPT